MRRNAITPILRSSTRATRRTSSSSPLPGPAPPASVSLRHLRPVSTESTTGTSSAKSPLSSLQTPPNPTTKLRFFDRVVNVAADGDAGHAGGLIPTFRVLDGVGGVLEGLEEDIREDLEKIPEELATKIYEHMLLLPSLDHILYNSQRQGRISFYMTSYGEEASVIGSAAAWGPGDEVFAQYREQGVLIWKGFTLDELLAQCFSSSNDKATKGRQMPVHYGSKELKFHTISSPLGTQIPQAAGAAYALKRIKDQQRTSQTASSSSSPSRKDDCVICYFGEGAASEGDFHAGMNMASVLGGPLVFFVRNNGFAISTPASEQFAGDGIAARGPGYGMQTIRVDGNDALAVYLASLRARNLAVKTSRPVLVEAMSYRVGHHSTSDDSSAYRTRTEVENWKKIDNPIARFKGFLVRKGWWDEAREEETKKRMKEDVVRAFGKAEKAKKPRLEEMWRDVYFDGEREGGEGGMREERGIREQREEQGRLLRKWGGVEPWKSELEKFEGAGKEVIQSK